MRATATTTCSCCGGPALAQYGRTERGTVIRIVWCRRCDEKKPE